MATASLDNQTSLSRQPVLFVMPLYVDVQESARHLEEAIDGILSQTDPNWLLVVLDDGSPISLHRPLLVELREKYPAKIKVIWDPVNRGPGACRNVGIRWAAQQGLPIILFNDADDISHPDRVKTVRELFLEYPSVDLVYSTFQVIDGDSNPVMARDIISRDIAAILQSHCCPVEGYDAWIKIGTVTGYTCLTSSTAVRTSIARECLFPNERVSEDAYLWMHIAARGNEFRYTPAIPSRYRILNTPSGSSQRRRMGKHEFHETEKRVDTAAFMNAIDIALERGRICQEQVEPLKSLFFRRLNEGLILAGEPELAESTVPAASQGEYVTHGL